VSSNCQKLTVRTVNHTHTTSDITDFVSGVSSIALDVLDDYNTGVAISGEPLFVSWSNSYSANLVSSYNTVNSNSANWNYQGTDIKTLTSDWEQVETVVKANSGIWSTGGSETDPIFTTWLGNSGSNLNSLFNVVKSNSSVQWNYQGTDLKTLSSNWQSTYNIVQTNSSNWENDLDNAEVNTFVNSNSSDIVLINTTVKNNSALWILSGSSISETDPIFTTWAQSYSSVIINTSNLTISNSSNWNAVYTTVQTNSSNWENDLDNAEVNTFVNSNSSDITLINNTVKNNSALWILSGNTISSTETDPVFTTWAQTYSSNYEVSYNNLISNSAAYLFVPDLSLSSNWQSTYTTVQTNSSNWENDSDNTEVNTFVNSNSSDIVLINNTVKNNSALWILSGSSTSEIDPVFTAWLNSSASNIQTLYSTVNSNSSITWNYQGTDLKTLSSDWQSSFITVQTNSSNWGNGGTDNTEVNTFVNSNSSDIVLINTTVKNNSALWILSGGVGTESDPIFTTWLESSALNIQTLYSAVTLNSATNWNYQGTDLKTLSSEWDSTKTTVMNNSTFWGIGDNTEVDTFVNTNSAGLISTDNVVKSNSSLWILSGISIESDPIFTTWAQSYSGVYTTVNANSSLWSVRGTDEVWIDAGAMAPQIGSPAQASTICLSSNYITFDCYDFDAGSVEYVHFKISPPLNWNLGNFKTRFYWTSTTGTVTTSAVFAIQSMVKNDLESIDQSWGTAVSVVDQLNTLSALHISDISNTITFSGTPTQNSLVYFRIYRDVNNVNDNLATDARLLGIKLQFGTLSTVTVW
jgi:hypothetical protein